jgi:hypothetical protein
LLGLSLRFSEADRSLLDRALEDNSLLGGFSPGLSLFTLSLGLSSGFLELSYLNSISYNFSASNFCN